MADYKFGRNSRQKCRTDKIMKIFSDILQRAAMLAVITAAAFIVSCTREPKSPGNQTVPAGEEISLDFSVTRGGNALPFEGTVKRVRVVIFGASNSSDRGRLLLNSYFPSVTDGETLRMVVTAGLRDIYLIVNEPLDGYGLPLAEYTNIAAAADTDALKLAYGGTDNTTATLDAWLPSDFVMFECYKNYRIEADGSTSIGQDILRATVKATLHINYKLSELSGDEVVFDSVCVKRLPKWSWLSPRSYYGGKYDEAYTDSEMQAIVAVRSGTGPDEKITSTNTFYLPEHILQDDDSFSYFEIYAHLKNNIEAVFKYTGKIGDGMDPAESGSDRYDLTRNTHYALTGNVVNYGDLQLGLEIEAVILAWNKYPFDIESGSDYRLSAENSLFTHNGGAAVFTVWSAAGMPQLKLAVENRDDFKISGTRQWQDGGLYYTQAGVVPVDETAGKVSSSRVYAVMNGMAVSEMTVLADAFWKFTWAVKTIDMGGGQTLRIMDRNIGSTSPECTGSLYERGSYSGLGTLTPETGTDILAVKPVALWSRNSWNAGDYRIDRVSDWTTYNGLKSAGTNCPDGWRLPTAGEMTAIMGMMQPYGVFGEAMVSGYIIPVMEGGSISFPAAGYFLWENAMSPFARLKTGSEGWYLIEKPESYPVADNPMFFFDKDGTVLTDGVSPQVHAVSVRCVQDGI